MSEKVHLVKSRDKLVKFSSQKYSGRIHYTVITVLLTIGVTGTFIPDAL